jgi:beta-glucosidase
MNAPSSARPAEARPAYLDASLPVSERVGDLLQRMTLAEKLAQLGSLWSFELLDGAVFSDELARARLAEGVGQVTRVAGATNLRPREVAEMANRIQRFLVEQTRLGIPAILHEECLHGLLAREATCYPQSIGQAATWDASLVEQMAHQIGRRLQAAGASQGLAPILDVTRDPRWGRIEETFGEDPYLVSELGCAYVRGLQATDPDGRPVIATGKHMVGHGVPEGGFNQAPAHIGQRELHDVFLVPFEAAVKEAGLGSMMHAYDDLDGVPCVASRELLTTILRDRWGFDGLVVSDYVGIPQLVTLHRMVEDLSAAATLTLEAGLDTELPTTAAYGEPLRQALDDGRIDPSLVDRAVSRVLTAKVRLGLFEHPYVDPSRAEAPADEERATALEMARRSLVLLQNDGTLPLREGLRSIAVIGPSADSARNLAGDYAHALHIETLLEMRGRAGVGGTAVPDGLEVLDEFADWATVRGAIAERLSPSTEVRFAAGCGITDGDDAGIAAAVEAAQGADVAVLVLGERSGLTDDCTCGETRDSRELGLPGRQGELLAAVAATGTPIVLVLVAGRPLAIETAAARCAAVLAAWVPGERGAEAVADALFGDVNPGGKLPVTVPRHVGQVPIYYAHKPSGGHSNWRDEYVDGSHLPLWPFGFGLSYTSFELRGLTLDRSTIGPTDEVSITVEVGNTGDRDGDEVVQLYARDVVASVTRPVRQLCGFRRVHLAPGEWRRVTFDLAAEQLAFTGRDGHLRVEPGRIQLAVGTSSADIACEAEVEIVGEPALPAGRSRFFSKVTVA